MTARCPAVAAVAAVAVTMALAAAPATVAHVQVRPAQVAPDDPVLFSVLVPSEAESGTRKVELAVPEGVIPFSFEDVAGWKRTLKEHPNGSLRSIVWQGRSRADGLAVFRFLASTPDEEGEIAWKALQTYGDGEVVRWIGSKTADAPASYVRVSRSVPRENAGGEGEVAAAEAPAAAPGSPAAAAPSAKEEDDGTDWVARALALAALLAAVAGGLVAGRRRMTAP